MAVLGVSLAVMTYGFVQINRGNRKIRCCCVVSPRNPRRHFSDPRLLRAEKAETASARKDILPFLQSEEDLR